MNPDLYSKLIKHSEIDYSNKCIVTYVKVIKQAKNNRARQILKHKLFLTLSKLFIKAINNFNHLTRAVPRHRVLHTPEDIAGECYLVYDNCLRNINMKHVKKFYFYLNTALNRGIYRLYEQQYQQHFPVVENTEENKHLLQNAAYQQHIDFSEIDLTGFSELELDIMRFKVVGSRLNVFLKEHHLNRVVFDSTLVQLKEKLAVIYKEEDYFKNFEMEQA